MSQYMSASERWDRKYQELMQFMRTHKRRPSKYRIEEHKMLNWVKFNKRRYAQGKLPPGREERFLELQQVMRQLQRVNQYAYKPSDDNQKQLDL